MNKIDEAWKAVKLLPKDKQEIAADALLDFAAQNDELELSDDQAAEIERRRREKSPKTMTLDEFSNRVKKLIS
ncbi:MAG: hypothetical protein ACREHE_14085 [Rhizomicrobium sp.]